MEKTVIKTNKAPVPVARYSQGIKIGNMLYTQGTIALDPQTNKMVEGDIIVQTKRVFESLTAILDSAGMKPEDVIKANVYVSDLKDFQEFNKLYNAYFPADPPPVRTTVQAKLPLNALVEVEVVAWKA
ncbi:MAG: hypothetical protein A3J83_06880 [Elusimicrobia bacterium RIFOXYA2_FULL_40_6]|nr:MAG: hypothetical protein A3J83_06880 [Elusimicrobia bacterium RIFOXYA2_FULL_40_6]